MPQIVSIVEGRAVAEYIGPGDPEDRIHLRLEIPGATREEALANLRACLEALCDADDLPKPSRTAQRTPEALGEALDGHHGPRAQQHRQRRQP